MNSKLAFSFEKISCDCNLPRLFEQKMFMEQGKKSSGVVDRRNENTYTNKVRKGHGLFVQRLTENSF